MWEISFENGGTLVDGPVNGQNGWLADDHWVVDTAAASLSTSKPFGHLSKNDPVTLGVWDRASLVVTAKVDFSKDVNQTPLRIGFTTTTNQEEQPIPLPFGNSSLDSTALAAELFRSGYPFLQSEGVAHHAGTVMFSPFFGADEGVVSLTGAEADIYPHARLLVQTLSNGDEDTSQNEIQFIAPIPLADGPAFDAEDSYRLIFAGEETSNLLMASIDSDVQAALEALPAVGSGNVSVTGDFAGGFEVTFLGAFLHQDLPQLEVIEPTVQDHLTHTLELTYDLLKTTTGKTFQVKVTVRNVDTGMTFSAPAEELVDNFAHGHSSFYPAIRGGNFAEGGRVIIEKIVLFREDGDDDNDDDGFLNRHEFQAGSDYQSAESTPISTSFLQTDFSTSRGLPLDESPDWFADSVWLTESAGGAALEVGASQRAISEVGAQVDPRSSLFLSLEFRLAGDVNLAIENASLFELGVTERIDPSAGGFRLISSLDSSTTGNGTLGFGGLELGSIGDFFETAGYDSTTTEEVLAGASRVTGPSDWIRLDLLLSKGELEGEWTVRKQLTDLEGDRRGRWEVSTNVIDVDLWNEVKLRGGFASGDGLSSSVVGGFEVRSFQSLMVKKGDYDGDRLPNIDEIFYGTDPVDQDSDGDLQGDSYEIARGSDPLDSASIVTGIPLETPFFRIENWGELRFSVTGPPSTRVVVEQSSDLETWTQFPSQPVQLNLFGEMEHYEYFDAAGDRELYFRVKETSD